jgi:hypothetical protein
MSTAIKHSLTTVVAVAALAVPSTALAMPIPGDPPPTPAISVHATQPGQPSPSGFDWTEAGIGTATVALLGAGTLRLALRRRTSATRTS